MRTINKPTESNLGGVVKVYAIRKEDVVWIGTDSFLLSTADNVRLIYCTPETVSFSEEQGNRDGNDYFDMLLQGFVPGDSDTVREAIMEMAGRKYLVLFEDGNGLYKLAGTLNYHLVFSSSFSTGANTSDRRGHTITFRGKATTKAIFINTPIAWVDEGSV